MRRERAPLSVFDFLPGQVRNLQHPWATRRKEQARNQHYRRQTLRLRHHSILLILFKSSPYPVALGGRRGMRLRETPPEASHLSPENVRPREIPAQSKGVPSDLPPLPSHSRRSCRVHKDSARVADDFKGFFLGPRSLLSPTPSRCHPLRPSAPRLVRCPGRGVSLMSVGAFHLPRSQDSSNV